METLNYIGTEFLTFEALLSSADFSISVETLDSTRELIDNYLTHAFHSFLSKLKLTDKANQGLIFLEEDDSGHEKVEQSHSETSWCRERIPPRVKISDFLTDVFCKLRKSVVKHVISLVDDRLAADQLAFSNIKKVILEQSQKFRDAAVLHRNTVELSLRFQSSERERFMKKEYKLELLNENQMLTEDLSALHSVYDTLYLVQEESTEQIHQCEETILILNENILTSLETAASLRGYITMMKEKHEEELEKLQVT